MVRYLKNNLFINYIFFTVILVLLISFAQSNSNNKLTNGGFENGDYRWNKWWGLELDKTQKHSGETSCKIKAKNIDWRGASQVILRPENSKIIIISGWIKTENILPNGKPWNNAQIGVRFMKTNDEEDMKNYVGKQYPPVVGSGTGTSDWKKHQREYSIPKECGFIEINLMCGTASGTAWFDDIYVEIK